MPSLEEIFKIRLVVARYGEMDKNRWWNTDGVLGLMGEIAYRRGLPQTHQFARARIVFAVARARCEELLSLPPSAVGLWRLPADIEDSFEESIIEWSEDGDELNPFFEDLKEPSQDSLTDFLVSHRLVDADSSANILAVSRRKPGPGLNLGAYQSVDLDLIRHLAVSFDLGTLGNPVVPYVTLK